MNENSVNDGIITVEPSLVEQHPHVDNHQREDSIQNQLSCKSNHKYHAIEICQLMNSTALQLTIKYATKSGKITLAQKIIDGLVEQKKNQEQQQKDIQRSSSPSSPSLPSYLSSTISISSSIIQEIKQTRPKVSTTNITFNNSFRKKVVTNSVNETSTTDELSKWKSSFHKSRLSSSNKIIIQSDVNIEMTTENEDNSLNGKRKIDEGKNKNEDNGKK